MTPEEYFKYAEKICQEAIELSRKKNHDYTNDSNDPFANFKSVETLGIPTEVGFLTRMQDKMMRLGTYVAKGELKVDDEGVQDTLKDLINYSLLFLGYLKSKEMPDLSTTFTVPASDAVSVLNIGDFHTSMKITDERYVVPTSKEHPYCGVPLKVVEQADGFITYKAPDGDVGAVAAEDTRPYEGYEREQKRSGIKEGDMVAVVRKVEPYWAGWSNSWPDSMNDYVDGIYSVRSTGLSYNSGITIDDWTFPYFALQIVEEQ